MRQGENALDVIDRVKQRIEQEMARKRERS
jgi:hypothetical protein